MWGLMVLKQRTNSPFLGLLLQFGGCSPELGRATCCPWSVQMLISSRRHSPGNTFTTHPEIMFYQLSGTSLSSIKLILKINHHKHHPSAGHPQIHIPSPDLWPKPWSWVSHCPVDISNRSSAKQTHLQLPQVSRWTLHPSDLTSILNASGSYNISNQNSLLECPSWHSG